MHDVRLMAVVDAGEDLLHEDGAVALAEFAALQDLVEELAALANLSDQVVALLVFEELVHFDDVGVVLYSHAQGRSWLTKFAAKIASCKMRRIQIEARLRGSA